MNSDVKIDVTTRVRSRLDLSLIHSSFSPFDDRRLVTGRSYESSGQKSVESYVFDSQRPSANVDVRDDIVCARREDDSRP